MASLIGSPFLFCEKLHQPLRIKVVDRNWELSFQLIIGHAVKKYRLVRFDRAFWNDNKISHNLVFHCQQVLASQQSRNRNIAAEIRVWDGEHI